MNLCKYTYPGFPMAGRERETERCRERYVKRKTGKIEREKKMFPRFL